MIVAVGSDHAGFDLKNALSAWLLEVGHEVIDVGTFSSDRVDYPEYGAQLGQLVSRGEAEMGVAVCGSGQGICMAANKVRGIRAAIIREVSDAQLSRAHNDANIACFGGRVTEPDVAKEALNVFLNTPFDGGRHADRVALLNNL